MSDKEIGNGIELEPAAADRPLVRRLPRPRQTKVIEEQVRAPQIAELHDVPFAKLVKVERNHKAVEYSELEATGTEEVAYGRGGSRTQAVFSVLTIDGRDILVRIESSSHLQVEGVIRELEPEERGILHGRAADLMLDCTMARFRMWSLGIAALGTLLILLGLDQLRRATRTPKPKSLRIFT